MAFTDTTELADLGSCILRFNRVKHELDVFQLGTETDGFTPTHIVIAGDKSIERLLRLLSNTTPAPKLKAVANET